MLNEKVEILFDTLSCTNAEIARYAGCSRSNICHIRSGKRSFNPSSKAIAHLVTGIYFYACDKDLLQTLCLLAETDETGAEILIPALTAWLFDTSITQIPVSDALFKPEKTPHRIVQRQEFGDKLNKVMNILELSNARLARTINVDDSLVSRWRSGLRSPLNNGHLSKILVNALLERARNMNCESKIADLSGIPKELLQEERGADFFISWLLHPDTASVIPAMDHLLKSINSLPTAPSAPLNSGQLSLELSHQDQKHYLKTEGLREAVLRFLMNAVMTGHELWLYSDESMEWMTGNAEFYAAWQTLMTACIQAGTKIKIIHNINRKMDEMLTAISGWMPLYMSGQIEPFIFRTPQSSPFFHTIFLNPGVECIYGTGVRDSTRSWYDYVTDAEHLTILSEEFEALFSCCEPLLKIYTEEEYTEHLKYISELMESGEDCRMTALSKLQLPDIRVCMTKQGVTVIHTQTPQAAFAFTAPDMLLAFREYFNTLHIWDTDI